MKRSLLTLLIASLATSLCAQTAPRQHRKSGGNKQPRPRRHPRAVHEAPLPACEREAFIRTNSLREGQRHLPGLQPAHPLAEGVPWRPARPGRGAGGQPHARHRARWWLTRPTSNSSCPRAAKSCRPKSSPSITRPTWPLLVFRAPAKATGLLRHLKPMELDTTARIGD